MAGSLSGMLTAAEMIGTLLVMLHTKTRTTSDAPVSSIDSTLHSQRYVILGKSSGSCAAVARVWVRDVEWK